MGKVLEFKSSNKVFGYISLNMNEEQVVFWTPEERLSKPEDGEPMYPDFSGKIVHIEPYGKTECQHSNVYHDKTGSFCMECSRKLKSVGWRVDE